MSRTIEKRRNKISSFLVTLRQMLNNQPPQYISWGKEQNEFKITNPSRFSQEALPKYFKHSNLSSFIRQLNIYDFKKLSSQKYPDEYIYSHPHFNKNKPELMKNIYRKVHHLPTKFHKLVHEDIANSSESFENNTINQKKKLREQVEKLQQKLKDLQSINSVLCQQNLQLQVKIPLSKNIHDQCLKSVYKLLMGSYEVQCLKFAQKIHHQLIERSNLFNELYQRHKQPQSNSAQMIDTSSKQSTNEKQKFDNTNYNSTSSGGSLNGHSSRQNSLSGCLANGKLVKQSDRKNQTLLRQQNKTIEFNNSKKINTLNQILIYPQNLISAHKNPIKNPSNSKLPDIDKIMVQQEQQQEKKNAQQQLFLDQCPSHFVIDLKNRRNQQQNDLSRMHKAIVFNQNQPNQQQVGFANLLHSK